MNSEKLLDNLKNDKNIPITWENNNEYLGKSNPIYKLPFNIENYIYIINKNNRLYLKFSVDTNDNFLILINDKDILINYLNIYLKGCEETKSNDKKPIKNILEFIKDKNLNNKFDDIQLIWNNSKFYFGGFIDSISFLENNAVFNIFLNNNPLIQATAFWMNKKYPEISAYDTIYSKSIIIYEVHTNFQIEFDENKFVYPFFVKINYPTCENNIETFEKAIMNTKFKNFPKNVPLDIVGALSDINLINEIDNIKKIFMDNEVSNEEQIGNEAIDIINYIKSVFEKNS